MKYTLRFFLTGCLTLFISCEGFFGVKTDPSFLEAPQTNNTLVAYVPIQPVWDELVAPVDVIAGWDRLIYVADAGTEEIISFDQAGNEIGRFPIPGLVSIAQDRQLDLLAIGTFDTTVNDFEYTLPTIYRLSLNKTGDYGLKNASIKNKIVHPYYFKSGTPASNDTVVSFRGIAPLGDNSFYVSRNGPANNIRNFGGPDNNILLFGAEDQLISPVVVNTSLGVSRDYFQLPQGICSRVQPPQTPAPMNDRTFFFTSTSPNTVRKVQQIDFISGTFESGYEVAELVVGDTSKADGFLSEVNRFTEPVDITISSGDNYIFVVDASTDSVYQFNAIGLEGVNPPPGINTTKNIAVSFGGTGSGLTEFNNPQGVAFLDEILYVADTGNGRILRFKLTIDFR